MGPLQGSVMSQRSTRETQRTTSGPLLLPSTCRVASALLSVPVLVLVVNCCRASVTDRPCVTKSVHVQELTCWMWA